MEGVDTLLGIGIVSVIIKAVVLLQSLQPHKNKLVLEIGKKKRNKKQRKILIKKLINYEKMRKLRRRFHVTAKPSNSGHSPTSALPFPTN